MTISKNTSGNEYKRQLWNETKGFRLEYLANHSSFAEKMCNGNLRLADSCGWGQEFRKKLSDITLKYYQQKRQIGV